MLDILIQRLGFLLDLLDSSYQKFVVQVFSGNEDYMEKQRVDIENNLVFEGYKIAYDETKAYYMITIRNLSSDYYSLEIKLLEGTGEAGHIEMNYFNNGSIDNPIRLQECLIAPNEELLLMECLAENLEVDFPDLELLHFYKVHLLPIPLKIFENESYLVTQGIYGTATHQNAYAIDIRMPIGTPIYSCLAGKVVELRDGIPNNEEDNDTPNRANLIVIEHGSSLTKFRSVYGHLNSRLREADFPILGETVTEKTLIAYSGNSGRSTGPHLHFHLENENGESLKWAFINPLEENQILYLGDKKCLDELNVNGLSQYLIE